MVMHQKELNCTNRKEEINSKISEYITTERRNTLVLSREEFAKKLGVRPFDIVKMESPDHDFTVSELCAVNKMINVAEYIKGLI